MKIVFWEYPEVEKILEDRRSKEELASEINRSPSAIAMVRSLATQYRKGNTKFVTKRLQDHFRQYYVNRGNMQLGRADEQTPVTQNREEPCQCESRLEEMTKSVDTQFDTLKQTLLSIAEMSVQHQNHALATENTQLRQWKRENEPELLRLQEFETAAKGSNFASMLRRRIQPKN